MSWYSLHLINDLVFCFYISQIIIIIEMQVSHSDRITAEAIIRIYGGYLNDPTLLINCPNSYQFVLIHG